MQKPFKVGLIGVSHNHVWHILDSLQEGELGTLAAASVENIPELEDRRQRLRNEYGLEKVYGDYAEMLDQEDIDVVFIYGDHLLRAASTILAASKGLPVMIEKPIAYNLDDAERMLEAAEANNVKLMVNWPTVWSPGYRKAIELVSDGAIGDLFHVRGRFGHSGPRKESFGDFYDFVWMGTEAAGGAFVDFCCYGAALTLQLLGMPTRVFGMMDNFARPFIAGPDNGVLVMMYDNAAATIEGTWSQIGRIPGGPMIYGTKGTISLGETPMIYTDEKPQGEPLPLEPLPDGEKNPVEYFLTSIAEDRPIGMMCDPKLSRDAQEVLEAGMISSQRGQVVATPLSEG